ncbi:peptidoglycan-binding domain-containing protein [Oceaniglobus trochenteri]|uniref:peptidoglycan-binding domain-containing protein n=1 Tax=Oceaniglobus trochenteri TaxID=2763260 RepID=UPI001CFFC28F|nr:peptidoglycan-binding protein [Oceaniglobus trochenteri]
MTRSLFAKGGIMALLIGALGTPSWAEDIALVIGNRDYRGAAPVTGADEVVNAAKALRDNAVTVVQGEDATLADLRGLLGQFEQMAPSADGLLVVLAGQFVQGGNDTFFLPVDDDRPGLTGLAAQSLSISSVLQILSTAPGEAVLVLAEDGRRGERGPFLQDGIGPLDVPQGVTLVQGAPLPVANLVRRVLAVPGAPLDAVEGGSLRLSGFLPEGHSFLSDGDRESDDGALRDALDDADRQRRRADRAERAAAEARSTAREAEVSLARADEALWRMAQTEDSASGYARYVDVFPDGAHATEAARLIRGIRDEPYRDARLAEEALSLSRGQRQAVQRDLTALGYNTRGIDGIFGPGTRSAIRAWQAQAGQVQSGYLDGAQLRRLDREVKRKQEQAAAEERARQEEARRRDDAFWRELGSGRTEEALRRYLERYARGQWSDQARAQLAEIEQARRVEEERQADDAFWQRLGAGQDERALRRYLERFPRGRWSREARNRLERIEQDRAAEARREEERRAEQARREEARKAEEARRQKEERERADNDYWRRTGARGSEEGLRAYLREFPEGVHANEARDAIAQLLNDSGIDVPKAEQIAWEKAAAQNTPESYRVYVIAYPNGYWIAEAKKRLARLVNGTDSEREQARAEEAALGLSRPLRRAAEDRLAALGYDVGKVDGKFDRQTRRGITDYQRNTGLPATGFLSEQMVVQLLQDSIRNLLR